MALRYNIKTSTAEDIYVHLEKCNNFFVPPLEQRTDLKEFSEKIFQKAITFEYWDNQVLVGMVSAYFNDKKNLTGFINNVSILDEYKKKNIASNLLTMCLKYAEQHEFTEIMLEVSKNNNPAIQLYKKFGFYNFEYRYDFIIMKKEITFSEKINKQGNNEKKL